MNTLPVVPLGQAVQFSTDFMDLTGKRKGRLTVIGYGGRSKSRRGARWVCRCDCGNHQYFSTKSLQQSHPAVQCRECCDVQKATTNE